MATRGPFREAHSVSIGKHQSNTCNLFKWTLGTATRKMRRTEEIQLDSTHSRRRIGLLVRVHSILHIPIECWRCRVDENGWQKNRTDHVECVNWRVQAINSHKNENRAFLFALNPMLRRYHVFFYLTNPTFRLKKSVCGEFTSFESFLVSSFVERNRVNLILWFVSWIKMSHWLRYQLSCSRWSVDFCILEQNETKENDRRLFAFNKIHSFILTSQWQT